MDRGKWIIVLALILLAVPVSAEMFKYVDKDGNVVYTDDLTVVPEEQRPGIEVFDEITDKADLAPEDKEPGQEQTATTKTEDSEEITMRLEKQREALDKEGKALEEEMQALQAEKDAFLSSRRFKSGPDSRVTRQLKALNQKIAASNKKIQDFKKKKAAHEAEMKALRGE